MKRAQRLGGGTPLHRRAGTTPRRVFLLGFLLGLATLPVVLDHRVRGHTITATFDRSHTPYAIRSCQW